MKKRLLAVYVASTLASIGGIWTDGGSGRRKRGTGHRRSPAERIAERAKARRMSKGD